MSLLIEFLISLAAGVSSGVISGLITNKLRIRKFKKLANNDLIPNENTSKGLQLAIILALCITLGVFVFLQFNFSNNQYAFSNIKGSDINISPSNSELNNQNQSSLIRQVQLSPSNNSPSVSSIPTDVTLLEGETYTLIADGIVSGDVIINNQKLYDDDPLTSLLVVCKTGTQIEAPFGCYVSYNRNLEQMKKANIAKGYSEELIIIKQAN